jgi:quinol monooxygenase YgiN
LPAARRCVTFPVAGGDGTVVIVDEWETVEQFQQFFSAPELQAFVASAGGDTSSPPQVIVAQAVSSADQF